MIGMVSRGGSGGMGTDDGDSLLSLSLSISSFVRPPHHSYLRSHISAGSSPYFVFVLVLVPCVFEAVVVAVATAEGGAGGRTMVFTK